MILCKVTSYAQMKKMFLCICYISLIDSCQQVVTIEALALKAAWQIAAYEQLPKILNVCVWHSWPAGLGVFWRGVHGFNSFWGLWNFLCLMLASCWLVLCYIIWICFIFISYNPPPQCSLSPSSKMVVMKRLNCISNVLEWETE